MPALLDAGVGDDSHINAIANTLGDNGLQLLFVTHEDPHHNGGLAAIRWKWQHVRVVKFGEFAEQTLPAGDTELRPIHTPGHAPDHLCFLDEREGELYCGDLLRAGGTIVIPASQGGDLAQYLSSLNRIRALKVRRIYPGHGPVIDEPAAVIDEYIRHRARREAQILEALRGGTTSLEAIVTRVYGMLDPPFAAAAADTVLAHLLKLRNEGTASSVGIPWEQNPADVPAAAWEWHLAARDDPSR